MSRPPTGYECPAAGAPFGRLPRSDRDDDHRSLRLGQQRPHSRARRVAGPLGVALSGADDHPVGITLGRDVTDDRRGLARPPDGLDRCPRKSGPGDVARVASVPLCYPILGGCHDDHPVGAGEVVTGRRRRVHRCRPDDCCHGLASEPGSSTPFPEPVCRCEPSTQA